MSSSIAELRRAMVGSTSITELRRAPASAPDAALDRARLGTALLRSGSVREAERELRAAVEIDPACAAAWVNLGGILLSRWEFAEAVEANRRAAAAQPALALAHFNQAVSHLHLGEAARAAECLGRAVELEPRNGAAFFHLAIALHALRRADEARLCAAYAAELGYRPPPVSAEALRQAEAWAQPFQVEQRKVHRRQTRKEIDMSQLKVGDLVLDLDEDGFIQQPEKWDKNVALALAETEGLKELGEKHWQLVHYLREHYQKFGVAPMIRKVCKDNNMKLQEIYDLFPSGPAKGACKVAGLPKPTGCV